jgi:Zn-dependent protease
MERDRTQISRRKIGSPIAEPRGPGENHRLMHEQRPSEPDGEYLPPPDQKPATNKPTGWRAGAGIAGAIWMFFAKFKAALYLLTSIKYVVLLPKLLALFVSLFFYALLFGWKFGIVFVMLILVHELGHYLTFRNFGIKADLPFFIPGLGAFVAARGPAPSLTIEALATLAGPIYGLAAAILCWVISVQTHSPFWMAAAYTGFFLNAINLLPVPPLDGGGIVAAIDPRLWILGAVLFLGFVLYFHIWAGLLFVALVGFVAVPRIRALLRGYIDPRFAGVSRTSRIAIAAAYFVTAALAVGGSFATYFDPRAHL